VYPYLLDLGVKISIDGKGRALDNPITNSNAMNGLVPGTTVTYTWAPWRIGLVIFDVFAVAALVFAAARILRKKKEGSIQ